MRRATSTSRGQPAAAGPAAPRRYVTDRQQIERGIVIELVSDDHSRRWTRTELRQELFDVEPTSIGDALERLKAMGVVHLDGDLVWASKCARYMYAIGLVMP